MFLVFAEKIMCKWESVMLKCNFKQFSQTNFRLALHFTSHPRDFIRKWVEQHILLYTSVFLITHEKIKKSYFYCVRQPESLVIWSLFTHTQEYSETPLTSSAFYYLPSVFSVMIYQTLLNQEQLCITKAYDITIHGLFWIQYHDCSGLCGQTYKYKRPEKCHIKTLNIKSQNLLFCFCLGNNLGDGHRASLLPTACWRAGKVLRRCKGTAEQVARIPRNSQGRFRSDSNRDVWVMGTRQVVFPQLAGELGKSLNDARTDFYKSRLPDDLLGATS